MNALPTTTDQGDNGAESCRPRTSRELEAASVVSLRRARIGGAA